ncbi:cadherin-related family member 5 isoform X1 [Coregonus clupeaformis]|uniref:cadherin-related family member 5 isoform X1 n=1 Tax=Coregonus clupeaformis TaxID=59861 RepID=UPI001BDFB862|nr:cadherin-related family member 5 isoform X1 [Coregonus clupeaformis]
MEQKYPHFTLRTVLSFLLVFLLHRSTQQICSVPGNIFTITENNDVGAFVTTITTEVGVILTITSNPADSFGLSGNNLIVVKVMDYETTTSFTVDLQCRKGDQVLPLPIVVLIENVNDNPPVFTESQYTLNVNELSPVGTSVGAFVAVDADDHQLYYRLMPDTAGFRLQDNSPNILVQQVLDYDTVKMVTLTLFAQDTPTPTPPSFTATATIHVNILDIDNRPPWFQPCTETTVGLSKICLSSGYTGKVNLTEQEVGALPLQPGPVRAIDGDKGLNVPIMYSFLTENGIFDINQNTGEITMLKAADVAGPLTLTVLALQTSNSDQFATTTVTIVVVTKSVNPPRFEKTEYEGFISADAGIDSMVLESKASNRPLRVQAKDKDFADGFNPDVRYEVQESRGFSITPQGFILMAQNLEPGHVSLHLRAIDSFNAESTTATLTVEIMPGITTMAPTTTDMATTDMATTDMATTDMATTEMATTEMATTEMVTTEMATTEMATTEMATATPATINSTTEGILGAPGGYGPGDMAALGASMAVLLVISMVFIGLLVFRIQKGKTDWRKLSEASIFRSSLGKGPGELKDGVQYTNEGFQNDGDTSSVGSKGPEEMDGKWAIGNGVTSRAVEETVIKVSAPMYPNLLPDTSSLAGSDKADSEKEVKPILTKERRMEEGYKSVWFKEDIDPNAKEEVVIIPDNGEREGDDDDDDDEEEEVSREEEEEYDNSSPQTPKVFFSDADLDDGRGARFEDEKIQTSDL